MLKLKDANVLIVKEFPNKSIGISSLLLSLGIKQHKIIHLNAPHEPLNRTFHERFDILICDQSYRRNQVKACDLLNELNAMQTIDEHSTIIMDCFESNIKDVSYYLADIHLRPEDTQRDINELIRKVFEKKNKVWPLLQREHDFSEQEMTKRYQFFEQHYPEYQYDLMLNRGHQYLLNRDLKAATELYGALIKEASKKDYSLEVSFFLNALSLNGQSEDALELHEKFDVSKVQFGQPFDEMGALLLLKNGHFQRAYRMLSTSGIRYGHNLAQRTMIGLMGIVMGKTEQALEHFSSNLASAKLLNRDVASHMLNYMFALLMLWMKGGEGAALYEKKYQQMLKEVSRYKLSEADSLQLAMIKLHGDCLTIGSQHAESLISGLTKKLAKVSCTSKIHALYLASGLGDKAYFYELRRDLIHCESVFMIDPIPPFCAAITKSIDFSEFAREMAKFQREKVE